MAYASLTLRDTYVNLRTAPYEPGELTDLDNNVYKLVTYFANIPNSEIGNEPVEGFAAFSDDGTTATRGLASHTLNNFKGFFAKKTFSDDRANPDYISLSSNFPVPICARGRICVFAATPIFTRPTEPTYVITAVPAGSKYLVGSLAQGTPPTGVTFLDISSACRVKTGAAKPNNLVLVDILIK